MGSYGIGVSRLVGAIIEAKYDEKNEIMKWPISVAPYELSIIPMINKNDMTALDKANKIYAELKKDKIRTICISPGSIKTNMGKRDKKQYELTVRGENFVSNTGVAFDYINASSSIINHVFTFMFDPERMNRIYQQNMFGKNILTLEDYFSKMQDSFFNNDNPIFVIISLPLNI